MLAASLCGTVMVLFSRVFKVWENMFYENYHRHPRGWRGRGRLWGGLR